MHVVYIECGIDGADHPVQRAAAVFVSKFVPTVLDAAPRATVLQCSDETAVTIKVRSPGAKAPPTSPVSRYYPRMRAAGTMKLATISRSRSSSCVSSSSRRA